MRLGSRMRIEQLSHDVSLYTNSLDFQPCNIRRNRLITEAEAKNSFSKYKGFLATAAQIKISVQLLIKFHRKNVGPAKLLNQHHLNLRKIHIDGAH